MYDKKIPLWGGEKKNNLKFWNVSLMYFSILLFDSDANLPKLKIFFLIK